MNSLRLEVPTLLEYFAALVADDEHFFQLEAAVSVGQDDDPGLDVQAVLAQIDAMAAKLESRLAADASALHKLHCLNLYFFQELGFSGNVNDYYDPRNSYLHHVLATRRGIPITLALLYIEIAQHIGLQARPLSFPGHFLVKLKVPQGEVIVDPFTGQSLSRDALDERLAPFRQRQGLVGDFEVPLGLYLQVANGRDVIARLLRNLQQLHRDARQWQRWLAVQHRLVILLPDDWAERRDRGLAHAELGQHDKAADDLAKYLESCPDAADAGAVAARLTQIHQCLRPKLH